MYVVWICANDSSIKKKYVTLLSMLVWGFILLDAHFCLS